MSPMLFGLIVIGLIAVWAIGSYNRLVKLSSLKDEGWSGVMTQLKRRHDLIPNLAASAKGLAGHEKELMTGVAQARAAQAGGMKEISQAEGALTQALGRFIAVSERYPELKADTAFHTLMDQLTSLENDIQLARRYFNGTARAYNIAVQSFPTLIIARMAGYAKAEYFELDSEAEAQAPKVEF